MFGSSNSSQPPSQKQQPNQNLQQFPLTFPNEQPAQNVAFNRGLAQPPAPSFNDTTFQPTHYSPSQETKQSSQNLSFSLQTQPSAGPNIMAINQPEGIFTSHFNFLLFND